MLPFTFPPPCGISWLSSFLRRVRPGFGPNSVVFLLPSVFFLVTSACPQLVLFEQSDSHVPRHFSCFLVFYDNTAPSPFVHFPLPIGRVFFSGIDELGLIPPSPFFRGPSLLNVSVSGSVFPLHIGTVSCRPFVPPPYDRITGLCASPLAPFPIPSPV